MKGCRFPWDRDRARPHATLHLPPLEANQALLIWDILEHVIDALWQAHGDAMVDALPDYFQEDPALKEDRFSAQYSEQCDCHVPSSNDEQP